MSQQHIPTSDPQEGQQSQEEAQRTPLASEEYSGETCPACGGTAIDAMDVPTYTDRGIVVLMACYDCNAAWKESYALVGYGELELRPELA